MKHRAVMTAIWVADRPWLTIWSAALFFVAMMVVPTFDKGFPVIDDVRVVSVRYTDLDRVEWQVEFCRHKAAWRIERAGYSYVFANPTVPAIPAWPVDRVKVDGARDPVGPDFNSYAAQCDPPYRNTYTTQLPANAGPGDRILGRVTYRGPFPLSYYTTTYDFGEVTLPARPEVYVPSQKMIQRQLERAQR